jgi:DNA-binding MarR family transcriptional regulator
MSTQTPVIDAVRALARASRVLERASGELSLPHYRVLAAIASGEERASRIATRLTLGKPTVSASVEALVKRGLLERSSSPGDQRVALLHITASGQETLDLVEAQMAARVAELAARTPDADQLLQSLGWLGAALEDVATERAATSGTAE